MEKLASFDVDVYRGIRHLLGFCITAQCSIIGKKNSAKRNLLRSF